ncbi:outer membrane protein [Albidovulum sediminicola]|uniref:Porin family protein n=1 Tax=Albidovulum sediminicola TaxID=2984331 RepID=A0ABT2YZN1_9RHOB|nr:porin family protein [Defluviimonas sp. WL0075]MCV2864339.1 porin family protein [Defluviimonas sp. WL0075]
MRKLTYLALIAAIAGAAPAFAGGLSELVPEPVIQPVVPLATGADWTGGYVTGRLGYGDVTDPTGGDGLTYGIGGGYDWDLGDWVVGVAGNYDGANIDLDTAGDSLDSIARLGVRAGRDLGSTLVYATAGAARADATIGGADLSDSGWYAGIGLDYALTDRMTVGGELLTNRFDDFDGTGSDLRATTASVNLGLRF